MNPVLDSFTLSNCLARPRRLSGLSAWVEHIPFAMNLIAAIRPATFAELGTHAGDSYCAFCQAVAERALGTRCYAVDTWRGDAHSRLYGPEVLADLRAHHDPLYGGFSRLIESSFDEALAHFGDGSIDLLHVDGLHTYEAVRHDFESWLPKMSVSGVVLIHDVNVREHDFGVARLWAELRARYPFFEFHHGHGLGVLAVGARPPEALAPLLGVSSEDAAAVRAYFFELGHRIASESGAAAELARLAGELAAAQQKSARTEQELSAAGVRASAAERAVAEAEARASALAQENGALKRETAELNAALQRQVATVDKMTRTAVWQAGTRYWHARDRLLAPSSAPRRVFDRAAVFLKGRFTNGALAAVATAAITREAQYPLWLGQNELRPEGLVQLRAAAGQMGYRPLVSVITPVHNIDEAWLRRCVESVIEQTYDRWELCLVDDASTRPHVAKVLAEYAARDPRIRVRRLERNSGIVAASAAAMAMAKGEFVALLDHDDELSPDALREVVSALQDRRDLDLIYSDEDKLGEHGQRVEPFFKPDWSPDLLLSMNYICHLAVIRRSLMEEVGGFRPGFDGSQDYDLFLRLTERTDHVARIPKILYHWRKVPESAAAQRTAKPYALESGKRALEDALVRRGTQGSVETPVPGLYRVRHRIPEPRPRVSIIMPTRDRADLLRTCISSIEKRSSYHDYEIIVVDNGSSEPDALRYFEKIGSRHRVIPHDVPFNWSSINNFAARQARGDLLLFMNNDMEVVNDEWLEALVEQAVRPGVGAVGAKLLYPTDTIQHAGVILGLGGVAGHAFKHLPDDDPGYFYLPHIVRNCSAVTGACMMVPRQVFELVGGFDESLRVAFNDIDFCVRVRQKGYRIIYTPYSVLYHHESASRGPSHPPGDEALMKLRWATVLADDPFYSPNLTRDFEDYRLAV